MPIRRCGSSAPARARRWPAGRRKVSPPTVKVVKPVRDAKVSPIEEVDIQVAAEDEYPLQEMTLHYSVNGQPEKTINLLKQKGARKADGTTMLSMEDFKAVPGDIVSIYATTKDGKNSAKTDMSFIQAVPFEFNYTQSQQQGGGAAQPGGPQAKGPAESISVKLPDLAPTERAQALAMFGIKAAGPDEIAAHMATQKPPKLPASPPPTHRPAMQPTGRVS